MTSYNKSKMKCCEDGHNQHKISKTRDVKTGRFSTHPIHQNDIPKQCYLCSQNIHHECVEPQDCGCDCQDFIEDVIIT